VNRRLHHKDDKNESAGSSWPAPDDTTRRSKEDCGTAEWPSSRSVPKGKRAISAAGKLINNLKNKGGKSELERQSMK